MKRYFVLHLVFFGASLTVLTARSADRKIEVEIHVSDDAGHPIENAMVVLSLPRFGLGERDQRDDGITDHGGRVRLSGLAHHAYLVRAEKTGYYSNETPRRPLTTESSVSKFGSGLQPIHLELKRIRNPIPSIGMAVRDLRAPMLGTPIGFDFEKGDWIVPHGSGSHADVYLALEGYFNSTDDYQLQARVSFPRELDGIQIYEYESNSGSEFKFPYQAPLTGYADELSWKIARSGVTLRTGSGIAYIFRCRSEIHPDGTLKRALYGYLSGELRVGAIRNELTWNFVYDLNPTWTRNLEFDLKESCAPASGKLVVLP